MLKPSDMILTVSLHIHLQSDYDFLLNVINVGNLLACWQTKTTYITT
jgi:hypothetical protein